MVWIRYRLAVLVLFVAWALMGVSIALGTNGVGPRAFLLFAVIVAFRLLTANPIAVPHRNARPDPWLVVAKGRINRWAHWLRK